MNEADIRRHLAEHGIPEQMHDGLVLYLLHGVRPGHFLTAVLSNDLLEACKRGDAPNQAALANYIGFLYHHAPLDAWGSPETVNAWAAARQAVTR